MTNGNDMPQDTNIAQLIAYIRYNNFEVKESKLHSVFDILYKQYGRAADIPKTHPSRSGYLSENLVYELLIDGIANREWRTSRCCAIIPLAGLIADWDLLDELERTYMKSPLTHVGFSDL